MELYVMKTGKGYVKSTDPENPILVGIEKASVFPQADSALLKSLAETLKKQGEMDIRIARLDISETDYIREM